MVAKLGTLLFSPRCPGRVFAADRSLAYRLCSLPLCDTPRRSMPSKPGSTLPKLGTCFMAGEMPGGKPCWFKVPSLERVLLLVLEGFQPWNMPQHQIALRLSWGPLGDGLFSPARLGFATRSPAYRICCRMVGGFWVLSPSQNNPAAHVLSWGPKFSLQNSLEPDPPQIRSPA